MDAEDVRAKYGPGYWHFMHTIAFECWCRVGCKRCADKKCTDFCEKADLVARSFPCHMCRKSYAEDLLVTRSYFLNRGSDPGPPGSPDSTNICNMYEWTVHIHSMVNEKCGKSDRHPNHVERPTSVPHSEEWQRPQSDGASCCCKVQSSHAADNCDSISEWTDYYGPGYWNLAHNLAIRAGCTRSEATARMCVDLLDTLMKKAGFPEVSELNSLYSRSHPDLQSRMAPEEYKGIWNIAMFGWTCNLHNYCNYRSATRVGPKTDTGLLRKYDSQNSGGRARSQRRRKMLLPFLIASRHLTLARNVSSTGASRIRVLQVNIHYEIDLARAKCGTHLTRMRSCYGSVGRRLFSSRKTATLSACRPFCLRTEWKACCRLWEPSGNRVPFPLQIALFRTCNRVSCCFWPTCT